MKTLKTLIIAALMCSYLTNCQNAAPTPDTTNTNVVVTPPTPVTPPKVEDCGVKNPLEELVWLRNYVKNYTKDDISKIRVYTYIYQNKVLFEIQNMYDQSVHIFHVVDCKQNPVCSFGGFASYNLSIYDEINKTVTKTLIFNN